MSSLLDRRWYGWVLAERGSGTDELRREIEPSVGEIQTFAIAGCVEAIRGKVLEEILE